MTSVAAELGRADADRLWTETSTRVVDAFARMFGYAHTEPVDAIATSSTLTR